MLRVIAACGNGMGTSQLIKMKIEKVYKKLGVPVEIHHMSIGEAKSAAANYDVVFCAAPLVNNFAHLKGGKTRVIGLVNMLSESEIEKKINEA